VLTLAEGGVIMAERNPPGRTLLRKPFDKKSLAGKLFEVPA
jgi:hypothetical protein